MRRKNKCRVCGTEAEFDTYKVKEMFFGTGEEFLYFKCNECECMQIVEVPHDLGKYYSAEYYSYGRIEVPNTMTHEKIETRILDVGCGSGKWLIEKYLQGHVNLCGCDPFIEKDIEYEPNIKIRKSTIHEMTGKYDLIRLSDSFEHMTDPLETLQSIGKLLEESGICLLSMPVFPNAAYDIFGSNWYEWDAPRHIFLHSIKSMEYLCQKAGLQIDSINFNSKHNQFTSSLLYQKGIPYIQQDIEVIKDNFTDEELEQFNKYTEDLNQKGYGDHAVFVLKRKSSDCM